ncbi:MAG: hypothetical protein JWN30_236 [Bacilli bacterium]|nr:hypothetical protein [Bacilli bacterium]
MEWIVLAALAFISLIAVLALGNVGNDPYAIPQPVTRDAALSTASNWLQTKQNISTAGLVHTLQMQNDPDMEGYLQIEHLHQPFYHAYKQARSTVFWQVLFYQPGTQIRYSVDVDSATGLIVGYGLYPPADVRSVAGTGNTSLTLSAEQVRSAALSQLEAMGHLPSTLNYVGTAYTTSPAAVLELLDDETGRTVPVSGKLTVTNGDRNAPYLYVVTLSDTAWKLRPDQPNLLQYRVLVAAIPTAKDATQQVIGFHEVYQVPGSTIVSLTNQRTLAKYLTAVYALGTFLLWLFGVIVMFRYDRSKVRFSRGWLYIVVSTALFLISQFNSWPTLLQQISGTAFGGLLSGVQSNLLYFSVFTVVSVVVTVALLYVSVVAGAPMAEDLWPGKWMTRDQKGWKERVWQASLRGYLLAVIWMALEAVFYLIFDNYFGSWSESDASQSPWNLAIPGLFPVLAWVAGTQEEATYRLLGISLLKRYFPRNTVIALVVPAMIWALGHALYPVYPFYTRFIELTLFGVLIGCCFLRWDFETVVFAHATYDSILMAQVLFSGTRIDWVWGAFFVALPFLIGFYAHLLQGKPTSSRGVSG